MAAYVPTIRGGRHTGLVIESNPTGMTADSFAQLTGSGREYESWQAFRAQLATAGETLRPTLLEPLRSAAEMRERLAPETWEMLAERPLGRTLESRFADDLVRGLVATDALIGTFADLNDPELQPNRTFLQHAVIGSSGAWQVPLGGMGALTDLLEGAVRRHGGEIVTRAFVTARAHRRPRGAGDLPPRRRRAQRRPAPTCWATSRPG